MGHTDMHTHTHTQTHTHTHTHCKTSPTYTHTHTPVPCPADRCCHVQLVLNVSIINCYVDKTYCSSFFLSNVELVIPKGYLGVIRCQKKKKKKKKKVPAVDTTA